MSVDGDKYLADVYRLNPKDQMDRGRPNSREPRVKIVGGAICEFKYERGICDSGPSWSCFEQAWLPL